MRRRIYREVFRWKWLLGLIHRIGDLEIAEDLDAQRHHWIAERVGWTVIALVMVAAVLGLFGPGLLNRARVANADGRFRLEYSHFGRYRAPTTLRLHLGPNATSGAKVRVWVDRKFIEGVEVQNITPPPDSAELGADRVTYVFQISDASRPAAITFYLEPERVGALSGRIGLESKSPVHFEQFIYP